MEENKIIAYKGFDENLKCRGFQYEVGKEYEHDGKVECCQSGFHACTNPFDVLDYYNANGKNRFCVVEQSGTINSEDKDSKQSSSKIKIKAEIGIDGLFKAGVEWIKEKTNPDKIIKSIKKNENTESGDSAKICSSDYYAKIGSSDDYVQIGSSGDCVQIGSSGNSAKIGSSGYTTQIGSSGDCVQIGSSGDYSEIGSSGCSAKIGSSGYATQIGSSGYATQIGSSGDCVQIGSSGYATQIGSSGDSAKIGSSGNSAKIGSSGDYAQIGSTGKYSIICCAGNNSMAKAKKGSWITLSEWKYSEDKKRYIPVCVKTKFVDGKRIKEDTWYKLIDGEFVEQK